MVKFVTVVLKEAALGERLYSEAPQISQERVCGYFNFLLRLFWREAVVVVYVHLLPQSVSVLPKWYIVGLRVRDKELPVLLCSIEFPEQAFLA